jgi:hypothetical protein
VRRGVCRWTGSVDPSSGSSGLRNMSKC